MKNDFIIDTVIEHECGDDTPFVKEKRLSIARVTNSSREFFIFENPEDHQSSALQGLKMFYFSGDPYSGNDHECHSEADESQEGKSITTTRFDGDVRKVERLESEVFEWNKHQVKLHVLIFFEGEKKRLVILMAKPDAKGIHILHAGHVHNF